MQPVTIGGYVPSIAPAPQSNVQEQYASPAEFGTSTPQDAEESPKTRQESIEAKRPTATEGDDCAAPSAPLDASELPSIGSAGHFDGSCKRCAFFPKGRCKNGKDCTHCHYEHLPRSRLRKRDPTRSRGSHANESVESIPEDSVESIPDEPTSDTESPLSDDPALSEPELADGFPSSATTAEETTTPDEVAEVDTAATSSAAVSDDDMPARTSSEASSNESPS